MSDNFPPMSIRQAILGATVETVSGTAQLPTAALNNTVVYDAKMMADGLFEGGESAPVGNFGGTEPSTPGPQKGKASFRTELRFGDATPTLLSAAGFSVAGGVATADYINLANHQTLTLALWEGGRRKHLFGASCSKCEIAPESNGQRIYLDWEFSGVWGGVVNDAMPADTTVTTAAMRSAGITLTEDGSEIPQVSGWSVDLGPETNQRGDATSPTALNRYQVEDGRPKLKLDPEARLVDQYDAYGLLLAGGTHAIVLGLSDGAGNTCTISMPRAQRMSVTDAEREKKRVDEVEFMLHRNAASAGVVITFAAA